MKKINNIFSHGDQKNKITEQPPGIEPITAIEDNYVDLSFDENHAMRIRMGNAQDQGARPYQEDSFGYSNITNSDIVSSRGITAVLSDGMGGLSNGKAVSEYVVSNVISLASELTPSGNMGKQLADIILMINKTISEKYTDGVRSTAGATAVVIHIYKNKISWACVGDSRLYVIRNSGIYQINEDHDYLNTMLRGVIDDENTIEDARTDPQKASLTSFVGKGELSLVDYSKHEFDIIPGDTFMLCSDGVYNAVSSEHLRDIILSAPPQKAGEMIVDAVLKASIPGQDNLTAMLIHCETC